MSNNNNTNDYNDRERHVLELYDQGKSTRDIAKELRMSLRDISIILKKHGVNHGLAMIDDVDDNNKKSHSNNEKATQAYKLFSEGRKPIQVAIEVGLREKQVNNFFREFWKLKNLNGLYEIYPQIEHCLPSFLKLHKALNKKGLNPNNVEWFADAIEMGVVKLPEFQGQYQSLQNKIWRMEHRKQELERDCQVIQRETMELTQTHNMLQQSFDTLADKVDDLYNEKHQVEEFVSRFKNGNRNYLMIRGVAEEIVYGLLTEQGALLTSAIIAVIQALKENPDKYNIIFDNSEYDNNSEYLEGLLEVAKSFLKILSTQIVDKTMVEAAAVKGK